MNRALLNPFEALKLPDNLELYLESDAGKATCMAFNRHGNVLAVGSSSGQIPLWDFDTRCSDNAPVHFVGGQAPCESWPPKGHGVTAVSFPAPRIGGHILASFSAASPSPPATAANGVAPKSAPQSRNGVVRSEHGTGVIRLCSTLDGTIFTEINFDMPIIHFVPHPTQPDIMVVLPANKYPLIVTIAPGRCSIHSQDVYMAPVGPDICRSFPTEPLPADMSKNGTVTVSVLHNEIGDDAGGERRMVVPLQPSLSANGRRTNKNKNVLDPYAVSISRSGRRIVRGGPDGIVHVYEFTSPFSGTGASKSQSKARLVNQFKVATGAAIRSLTLTKAKLLVNSADRSLRLFDANSIVPPQGAEGEALSTVPVVKTIFTEAVNRSQAKCACFSRDGDFVLAGMLSGSQHRINVWRASDGHPETTLEGPNEGLRDLVWHPVQPVIASIGAQYGGVYIWAKNFTENWSAFAPQFTELEANEEYSENEGEFDAKHPSSDERVKLEREAEEEKIHVNVEAPFCFSSDEEDGDDSGEPSGPKRSKVHRPFFSLPAIPEPDSYLPYSSTDKDGNLARDIVKKQRTLKRQRSRALNGDPEGQGAHLAAKENTNGKQIRQPSNGNKKKKSSEPVPGTEAPAVRKGVDQEDDGADRQRIEGPQSSLAVDLEPDSKHFGARDPDLAAGISDPNLNDSVPDPITPIPVSSEHNASALAHILNEEAPTEGSQQFAKGNVSGRMSRQPSDGSKKMQASGPSANLQPSASKNAGEDVWKSSKDLPSEALGHSMALPFEPNTSGLGKSSASFAPGISEPVSAVSASESAPCQPMPGSSMHAPSAGHGGSDLPSVLGASTPSMSAPASDMIGRVPNLSARDWTSPVPVAHAQSAPGRVANPPGPAVRGLTASANLAAYDPDVSNADPSDLCYAQAGGGPAVGSSAAAEIDSAGASRHFAPPNAAVPVARKGLASDVYVIPGILEPGLPSQAPGNP